MTVTKEISNPSKLAQLGPSNQSKASPKNNAFQNSAANWRKRAYKIQQSKHVESRADADFPHTMPFYPAISQE